MFVSRTGLFGCLARWSKSSLANWNQLGLQEGCSWARGRSRVSSFRLDLGQTLGPRPMVRLRGAGRCRVWHERLTLCIAEGSLTIWDCWALLGSVELPCVHYMSSWSCPCGLQGQQRYLTLVSLSTGCWYTGYVCSRDTLLSFAGLCGHMCCLGFACQGRGLPALWVLPWE